MGHKFRKSDIEFHHSGNGYWPTPAVNVKTKGGYVTRELVEQVAKDNVEPTFVQWWDENEDKFSDDMRYDYWDFACQQAWEQLQADAEEIFGNVHVYSSGRSGGWAYIQEFTSHDGYGYDGPANGWDAIEVAKWARFAKYARLIADNVEYDMVTMILDNVFRPEHEAAQKRAFRALLRDAS